MGSRRRETEPMTRAITPAIPLARLRDLLARHRGRAKAISARDLALILGIRDNKTHFAVRSAILRLVEAGHPIGSVQTETGGGYFWIESEAELALVVRQYRSRIQELEARVERLVEAYRRGPRQPALAL